MRHTARIGLLLAGLAAAAPCQDRPITVLLRDPSRAPVAAANGWLLVEPPHGLPALPDPLPAAVAAALPRHRTVTAVSNERGVLRFLLADAPTVAGSGMVTTPDGLGALLPRLHAGRANRITLHPLAELTTPGASEEFTLHARAVLPSGETIPLPAQRGAKVRLPAGTYEIWAHNEDGIIWQRVQLRAGASTTLAFAGPVQRLQLPPHAIVHPAGQPALTLPSQDDELLLRGVALAAPLVTWFDGQVTPPRVVPGPPTRAPRAWPAESDRIADRENFRIAAGMPDDAHMFGLTRTDDGTFRVVGFAAARNGIVQLPPRGNDNSWLLLVAEGRAPHARPWSTTPPGSELGCERGTPLTIAARSDNGLPIADLRVLYVPDGQEAAAVRAYTDAVGHATFGRVTAPGKLFVHDARFANQEIELENVPSDAFEVVVAEGAMLQGTVTLEGVEAHQTVVVTLRDPLGQLQPATRTVVASTDKPFSFAGLPDSRNLVIFATAQHGGKTWSVRQVVQAGDDVALTLQNEDPRPFDGR